jgi:hypothetical protein
VHDQVPSLRDQAWRRTDETTRRPRHPPVPDLSAQADIASS